MMDQCADVLSSSDDGSRGNHHNHDNGDAHDVLTGERLRSTDGQFLVEAGFSTGPECINGTPTPGS